ncbi:CBS domain-containing protein [Pseudodesulfovibrio piezophilus]|uniref:CBS domain containing protein n=1 Tax=Pseudodesulfovibrio piezophilus (strain DSM 21447 / JCM 15486 / C1TLV30) TaxID=1322246 RepID=M1WTL7_PSEP2|nr:CBS domain-containing protein [Pseudodesulfovibrio piezophilus]CCH49722.1 CBS domain containing protein [Pseudodesulfovibrio piezophilus C1TLV30]
MLVRDWMTVNVISLGVNSSVMDAAEILREKNIRQFPVIDNKARLVGIVSDRDIRDAMPSKFLPGDAVCERGGGLYTLTAGDIMTLDPITVPSDTAVDEVANILVQHKVGGLPVVDGGELMGIITQADVLRFLCAASGAMRSSVQLAFRLATRPSALTELLVDIQAMGLVVSNVFTANDGNSRKAYIRIERLQDKSIEQVMDALQGKYTVLFYVNEGVTVDVS